MRTQVQVNISNTRSCRHTSCYIHLHVTGASSRAREGRYRLGGAARVLEHVNDRGQVTFISGDNQRQNHEHRDGQQQEMPVHAGAEEGGEESFDKTFNLRVRSFFFFSREAEDGFRKSQSPKEISAHSYAIRGSDEKAETSISKSRQKMVDLKKHECPLAHEYSTCAYS